MTYLISISIGPVQEFIASARRSRDLWFGSWLLSELSKAVAKKLAEKGTLIFPATKQGLPPDDVVNKIVAKLEMEDDTKLKEFLDKNVYQAIEGRLLTLGNDAFAGLEKVKINDNHPAFHQGYAVEQLKDLIEYYWAACPFNDPSRYHIVRSEVEALLLARKATRNFKRVGEWGGNKPKSSLDGLRESVIDEDVYDAVKKNKRHERWLRLTFGVRAGERLCGVGLLKRRGLRGDQDSFFSTSHVAALPLLERLTNKEVVADFLRELTKPYLLGIIDQTQIKKELGHVNPDATLKPHPFFCSQDGLLLYDGRLLFEERMREIWPAVEDKEKRETAKKALRTFFKTAFGSETIKPLPYYAILHADGDHMGTVIGELAKEGIEKHQDLSGKLSEFAKQVKTIVEKNHSGSCIYAGGDDVLALVPIHHALDCAKELSDSFSQQVQIANCSLSPTLSVGLAIGHHIDPLQDTLELAREAERIAKKVSGKNALAVTVSKRSGIDRTVKGSWHENAKEGSLYQRLNYFIYLHLRDELPDAAAYDLHDVSLRLKPPVDATKEQAETLWKAQCAEAKRILERKQSKHGKQKKLASEVIGKLLGMIQEHGLPLEQIAEEIIVARLFAQALEQAGVERDAKVEKDKVAIWAEEHGILLAQIQSETSGEASIQNNVEVEKL